MKRNIHVITLLILWWTLGSTVIGGSPAVETKPASKDVAASKDTAASKDAAREVLPIEASVTHHSLDIRGQGQGKTLSYRAVVGWLPIDDADQKPQVDLFYTAYMKDDADLLERPIAFVFNGGPGASSVFLHLGGLGPKRVSLPEEGTIAPAVVQLTDNDTTWLRFTDLVFVDPPGTGYSRTAEGVSPKKLYGLDEDARILATFVRKFVTNSGRWQSPKYLVGESYGGTRSAKMAAILQDDDNLSLTGVVLISSAINFRAFSFSQLNELGYVLAVPSYTAAAWFHNKLPTAVKSRELSQLLAETQQWAIDEYLPALAKGSSLADGERKRLADQLAQYTGILPDKWLDRDLRVDLGTFRRELLRDQHLVLGQLDDRVTMPALTEAVRDQRSDPALFLVQGPYLAAMHTYLRDDLKLMRKEPYEVLSSEVNQAWQWGSAIRGFVDVTGDLRHAMVSNPQLRVLMAAGLFDLTTSYSSQQYTAQHLLLPESLRANLVFHVYSAGHQIYTVDQAMQQLGNDVARFFSGE